MARAEKLTAHLAMLAFVAIISGSFSFGALAAPFMDASALNAIRFLLACVIMLIIGFVVYRQAPIITDSVWRFGILGGLSATYFITMFIALKISPPISTSAIFTLIPLMSAGFGWVFLRQSVNLRIFSGLLLAAFGALWVIFKGDFNALVQFQIGEGELIFLVGAIAYAAYAPLIRKLNRGENAFSFTFMILVGCTVLTLMVGFPELLAIQWGEVPSIVWLVIGFLALFSTAGSFFLLQHASMRLPASKVLSYGYLIPVFVILYEGMLGHGWASFSIWMGGLVAAAALLFTVMTPD